MTRGPETGLPVTCSSRRSGYVLLMSLVLICLATLLLAGLARHTLLFVAYASDSCEELQIRWGFVTLERSVLRRAPLIVRFHEQVQGQNSGTDTLPMEETILLGSTRFHIRLEDENTKANVNRLNALGGKNELNDILARLSNRALIDLRPHDPSDELISASGLYASWGQVFDLASIPATDTRSGWLTRNTQLVTCWGNGRLHFRYAPDDVFRELLTHRIGAMETGKFLQVRRDHPEAATVDELLDHLDLSSVKRRRLEWWLTDRSSCFCLRIKGQSMHRSWHRLCVYDSQTGAASVTFAW